MRLPDAGQPTAPHLDAIVADGLRGSARFLDPGAPLVRPLSALRHEVAVPPRAFATSNVLCR